MQSEGAVAVDDIFGETPVGVQKLVSFNVLHMLVSHAVQLCACNYGVD